MNLLRLAALAAVALAVASPAHAKGDKKKKGKDRPDVMDERPVEQVVIKPGSGVEIASADKAFSLKVGLRGQLRYEIAQEQDDGESVVTNALTVPRARMSLSGNAFGRKNKYKLQLAFAPDDLSKDETGLHRSPLLDAAWTFAQVDQANVTVGQFKVPFSREKLISSGKLQLVDRSVAHGEFELDRDMGLMIDSDKLLDSGLIGYSVGVFAGEGKDNVDAVEDFGFLYVARLEVRPLGVDGDKKDLDAFDYQGDLRRFRKPRLAFGGAVAWLDEGKLDRGVKGNMPDDGGTTDSLHVAGDVIFKLGGASVFSEVYWRQGTRNPGDLEDEDGDVIPPEDPRDGMGLTTQAGYLLPGVPVEVSGRYSMVRGAETDSSLGDKNELTMGISAYPGEHAFKVQADYGRLWSETMSDGENLVRLQLQLAF